MLPRRRATRQNARVRLPFGRGGVGTDEQAVAAHSPTRFTTKLSRWFAPKSVSVRASR